MSRALRSAVGATLLALLASACTDRSQPTSPFDGTQALPIPITPASLQMLSCHATVATGKVSCTDARPSGGADLSVVVGGQNQYVTLTASNPVVATGTLAVDVTVQNLIPQPMGTTDGVTPDGTGVDVFFATPPTMTGGSGSVSIGNATGTGVYLGGTQPYFRYGAGTLGADDILSPNETSGAIQWVFNIDPTVTTFTFSVYVSANVHYPNGYIDVSPGTALLVAGSTYPLTATLRSVVGDSGSGTVQWSSGAPGVATVDGAGLVSAVAMGHTTISATSGVRTGSAPLFVCPNMAVGDVVAIDSTEAGAFCLSGGSGASPAEYTLMPINQATAGSISSAVTGTGIVTAAGPPSPNRLAPSGLTLARLPDENELEVRDRFEAEMHEREARTLPSLAEGRAAWAREHDAGAADPRNDPLIAGMRSYPSTRPLAHRARTSAIAPDGISRLLTVGATAVGDSMDLNGSGACSGASSVRRGVVRSVSQHLIIVADTANPAGGFTTAQYDSIALEFDTIAWPVDSVAFGPPTDLDENQRVVAFFTRAVNELSPPASSVVTLGFFAGKDIFSSAPGSCPNSNEGEMFYMLVPDPTGVVNSNVRTMSFVRGNTTGTLGHEFQHLINATRRLYVNGGANFEEGFLNEGLSHIAEELMFYRTSVGLAPRQNIVLSNLTTGPNASRRVAAFNTYANQNYGRFRGWLLRPDTAGPLRTNQNSLAVRGAIWSFLRYTADRLNGDQNAFWYSLVNGTNDLTGIANLQHAMGVDPQRWARDWTVAMYTDDAVSTGAIYTNPSWSYRSLYTALNGSYQLAPRALTDGVGTTLGYVAGGATAYFRFGVPANTAAMFTVSNATPPSAMRLMVVRTK